MRYLKIEAKRDGYSPNDLRGLISVSELIEILQRYDEDLMVVLSHDNGYTFGAVTESSIDEDECLNEE